MRLADGGDGAEIRRILAEFAAHRAFELFGDDQTDTFDGIGHFRDVYRQLDRLVLRQDAPPVQEFTLQQTADQRCLADGEEDMLAAEEECAGFVRIAEDFFRFLQRCGRHDEFERPPDRFLRFPAAQRQPVAVDGDDRNRGILNLKQAAGMDGAGLIFADGKAGAADHGFEFILRHVF